MHTPGASRGDINDPHGLRRRLCPTRNAPRRLSASTLQPSRRRTLHAASGTETMHVYR